jgi:hypothetical protein
VSRDGGSWSTIALASRTTHLVGLRLATGHHYRYRARAIATTAQAGSWSTGPTVTVRGISDRSSAVRYSSGWSSASLSSYIDAEVRYTRTSQATATLLFDGRSVSWNGPAGPTRGSAKVYLDGHYVATVSAYASSFSARRVLFAYRAGTAGSHTLTIKALGTSGHPVVAIDWFTALSG